MLTTLKHLFVLLFTLVIAMPAEATNLDEVTEALAKAEGLYYEADFTRSIALLLPVDEMLRSQPEMVAEKISVKLQIALSYVGLNDTANAGLYFRQIYSLDADYALDRLRFSPKVVALADEARAEQAQARCRAANENARTQLEARNGEAVLSVLQTTKSRCPTLAEIEPALAELLYRAGLESYRKGDFDSALDTFRIAVGLSPQHELASQYLELTQSKLQVTADRLFVQWTRSFEARDFQLAAADYREMASLQTADSSELMNQARDEYRKVLSELVETSNRACINGDTATVESIRGRILEMLPEPSIGDGIVEQLSACAKKDCLQMNSQLVLARLKTRVDPEIPSSLQGLLRNSPITVRVRARIDEKGTMVVESAEGGNSAVNPPILAALARWKFTPVFDSEGPRCVDTELPIVITP
jgi:tetratricopeptide (TPR) repeat protein